MGGTSSWSRAGEQDRWAPLLAALVFLVAMNLRSSLTPVGALLPQISADHQLSEPMAGLLGALPLVTFAVVSPLVHHAASRLGPNRLLLAALLLLTVGILTRSYGASPGLWGGTVMIGCAIAVGNVLVPALIKRDYPRRIAGATALYSASMGIVAALAAGLAVPVSNSIGWHTSLAIWALPAFVVAMLWLPRARRSTAELQQISAPAAPPMSVWRQPVAWLVTAFMGLQSTVFFILLTWLPTIGTEAGFSAERAGLHLFSLQLAGIAAGLTIPRLMRRPDSQVGAALTASVPILVGALGLLLAPGLSLLWAIIAGAGTGSSLVVALSLISMRGRTQAETTQLSGMAQSMGYLFAAVGPVLAGTLAEGTGGWAATLLLVAGLALVQSLVAIVAGRDRDRHGLTR